jgi:hypothetical protein
MIHLYVSSKINKTGRDVVDALAKKNVECQIYENYSYTCCNKVEKGFYITLFTLRAMDFKELVWSVLQPLLELECGFVIEEGRYMGCVQDWPCIFRKSKCQAIKKIVNTSRHLITDPSTLPILQKKSNIREELFA